MFPFTVIGIFKIYSKEMYLYNSKRTFQCETKYFQVPNSKCTFLGTIEIKHQEPTLFYFFFFL